MRIQDLQLQSQLPRAYGVQPIASHLRSAAVLLPLVPQDDEDHILFTVRTQTLRKHKGQIAFPGGKQDPEDESLADTALRETHEEIGIAPQDIDILGALPPFPTHTGFFIYPYVGRIPWPTRLQPEPAEIDEVFQVPMSHLLQPDIYRLEQRTVDQKDYPVHFYQYQHYTIWGITAHILHDFLARVQHLPRG